MARLEPGSEQEEEAHEHGQREGFALGVEDGKDKERQKWIREGHRDGRCVPAEEYEITLF